MQSFLMKKNVPICEFRYSAVDLKREVLDFIVQKGWGDFKNVSTIKI